MKDKYRLPKKERLRRRRIAAGRTRRRCKGHAPVRYYTPRGLNR